MQTGN